MQWFSGKSREHHGAGLNKMVNAALASVESFGLLFGIHFFFIITNLSGLPNMDFSFYYVVLKQNYV